MILNFLRRCRRRKITSRAFPESWDACLRATIWHYRDLSGEQRQKFQNAVQILVADKLWEGCGGLRLNEDVKVIVAGFASLLLLGLEDYYFDPLQTILIYPGGYLDRSPRTIEPEFRFGEVHPQGPLIVSWWNPSRPGGAVRTGRVVLHEFAHLLEMWSGESSGTPAALDRFQWLEAMEDEYRRTVEDFEDGAASVLDDYATTNLREFFAVATESFFLASRRLQEARPRLYDLLATCYTQNPAAAFARASASYPDVESAADEEDDRNQDIRELTEVIESNPHPDAYRRRALAYLDGEQYERAVDDLDRLLEQVPDDDEALHDRGLAHYDLERYEEAIADFSRAIGLNPEDSETYLGRGLAHVRIGRFDEAIADYSTAARLRSDDTTAYAGRAEALIALGHLDRAADDCREALARDADFAVARRMHALVLHLEGDHERAVAECTEALAVEPDLPSSYRVRALAFRALGRAVEADRDEREAEELDPGGRSDPLVLPGA